MKLLLDECMPLDFRHSFPDHECHTAEWAGLKSKSNGELLRAAESAGYEVLITVDQGIAYQQNRNRRIAMIVLRSKTNQMEDILPFAEQIRRALISILPGEIVNVA